MDSDSIDWDPGQKADRGAMAVPRPLPRAHTDPEKDGGFFPSGDTEKDECRAQSFDRPPPRRNSRRSTAFAGDKATVPPPLSFDPWTKRNSIILCVLGLLFFDLVLPCLIYYILYALTSLDEQDVLGIACASLGLGEMMELPLRGWRLVRHREDYAPLGQSAKWGFDFFFWWYAVATVIGIVPYVMATDLDYAIEWLFLMAPGLILAFAVATAVVSAVPFRLPFRVSSDAKGERCKPFTYYIIEDFVAVDAAQKRAFRVELMARYNASQIFRQMIWEVNMWWAFGGVVFTGALSGMTWGMPFPVAYGLSYGLLFVWIGIWTLATWLWVKRALRMEREWFLQSGTSTDRDTDREGVMV
jgi:hypothetical protein